MSKCIAWQRARSDEQIEQRERAILVSAAQLFEEHRFVDITFAMIGKHAKFTRSNLYRYFSSKEEVFLKLLAEDIRDWRDRLLSRLEGGSLSVENFVDVWVPTMLASPRLLKLYDILATVLEEQSSDEAVLAFKQEMNDILQPLGNKMLDHKLFSSADGMMKFMTSQLALASGMYPKLHMSDRLQALSAQQGLAYSKEFYQALLIEASSALYKTFAQQKVK